jgi:hypothetical protein
MHKRINAPTHRQAAITLQPSMRSLHHPAAAITTQPPTVGPRRPHPPLAVRNHWHQSLRLQLVPQIVTIMPLVGDHRPCFGHSKQRVRLDRDRGGLLRGIGPSKSSRHPRSSMRGRPPLGEGGCWGNSGAIFCHCLSEITRGVFRDLFATFLIIATSPPSPGKTSSETGSRHLIGSKNVRRPSAAWLPLRGPNASIEYRQSSADPMQSAQFAQSSRYDRSIPSNRRIDRGTRPNSGQCRPCDTDGLSPVPPDERRE